MPLPNVFPAPFVVNPRLTGIAIAYSNNAFIADAVLPRVGVDTPSFLYSVFNKLDEFTSPDTKVGRTSEVNQVDWSATQASATVDDHALDEIVPRRDQAIAAAYGSSIDPKARATTQVTDLLGLSRENRAASIIFGAGSYASANKTTLASTGQWSDFINSDPLAAITAARDTMFVKPNQLVLGRAVASALRRHPKIVQSYNGTDGQYGIVPLAYLATLLEIDEVLVGEAWGNAAAKGQAANLSRVWGKSAALLYTNKVSPNENTPSFGITAQWGDRLTGEYFDFKKGMRGSDIVRVGESVKEVVLANDLGYLFQSAVA